MISEHFARGVAHGATSDPSEHAQLDASGEKNLIHQHMNCKSMHLHIVKLSMVMVIKQQEICPNCENLNFKRFILRRIIIRQNLSTLIV